MKCNKASAGLLTFIKYVLLDSRYSIAETLAWLLAWHCHCNSPALCYHVCDYLMTFLPSWGHRHLNFWTLSKLWVHVCTEKAMLSYI